MCNGRYVDPNVLFQHHQVLSDSLSSKLRQELPESAITNLCLERLQKQLKPPFQPVQIITENKKKKKKRWYKLWICVIQGFCC